MRVLLINKYFHITGGAERYFHNLGKMLTNNGHDVAYFCMQHPKNLKTKWGKYFVSYVNLRKPSETGRLKTVARLFYSQEARQKISLLLNKFKPDIVHYHNIYGHISPSILPEITRRNIPIINTAHDYHLIHPNPIMFHDGQICEITKNHSCLSAIAHKCLDRSPIYSSPPVIAFCIHKILKIYEHNTDTIIVPSQFMKNKLIEFGIDQNKIVNLPNYITKPKYKLSRRSTKYALYFGRLTTHKGLNYIIKAASTLPKINFKIIGKGQLASQLAHQIQSQKLTNITLEDFKQGKDLHQLINDATFTLLPAIWFENQPLAVLESFAHGKPVIANKIGGLPEMIKHKHNGLLCKPRNIKSLTNAIQNLWDNPRQTHRMGLNAQKTSEQKYSVSTHYSKLMSIYQTAINNNNPK